MEARLGSLQGMHMYMVDFHQLQSVITKDIRIDSILFRLIRVSVLT